MRCTSNKFSTERVGGRKRLLVSTNIIIITQRCCVVNSERNKNPNIFCERCKIVFWRARVALYTLCNDDADIVFVIVYGVPNYISIIFYTFFFLIIK